MMKRFFWTNIAKNMFFSVQLRALFLCRPLNGKEKTGLLCALCVSSEAGGEINIYSNSPTRKAQPGPSA